MLNGKPNSKTLGRCITEHPADCELFITRLHDLNCISPADIHIAFYYMLYEKLYLQHVAQGKHLSTVIQHLKAAAG